MKVGGTGPSPRGLQFGQKLLVQFLARSSSGVPRWTVMGSVHTANGLQQVGTCGRVSTCQASS